MTDQPTVYVMTVESEGSFLESLDGIVWHQAPVPRRWHRCWPQSRGQYKYTTLIERCPCGAVRLDGARWWIKKNSRRKEQP